MTKLSHPSFTFGVLSGVAGFGLYTLISRLIRQREEEKVECILFSPREMHFSRTSPTCDKLGCPLCSYSRLCNLLKSARYNLDICMYLITEPELADIIIRLFRKRVSIRILTDRQMSEEAFKCKTDFFFKQEIPMRYVNSKGMMHNKFFIIDNSVVVSGSCNWTLNGFMSNYENLLVIKKKNIARDYGNYFEKIWANESISLISPEVSPSHQETKKE